MQKQVHSEPPAPASLLELVRGTGGAPLAALLLPGTFLVSRERALPDAATLASAPNWLRWIIEHKHRHWVKSVYLLTRVEARPDSENGDVLIGVNVTRAKRSGAGSDDDDAPPDDDDYDDDDDESSRAPRRRPENAALGRYTHVGGGAERGTTSAPPPPPPPPMTTPTTSLSPGRTSAVPCTRDEG